MGGGGGTWLGLGKQGEGGGKRSKHIDVLFRVHWGPVSLRLHVGAMGEIDLDYRLARGRPAKLRIQSGGGGGGSDHPETLRCVPGGGVSGAGALEGWFPMVPVTSAPEWWLGRLCSAASSSTFPAPPAAS